MNKAVKGTGENAKHTAEKKTAVVMSRCDSISVSMHDIKGSGGWASAYAACKVNPTCAT